MSRPSLAINPPIREFRLVTRQETAVWGGEKHVFAEMVHISILEQYVAWLIEDRHAQEELPQRIDWIAVQEPRAIQDQSTWVEGLTPFEWGEKVFKLQPELRQEAPEG